MHVSVKENKINGKEVDLDLFKPRMKSWTRVGAQTVFFRHKVILPMVEDDL